MVQGKFVILDDRGVLAVGGPDRHQFLQGLVSNDVTHVTPNHAVYAALLTAQGKYLHDFIIIDAGHELWIDAEAARLADLKRRLLIYRLRAKVEIAERPEMKAAAAFDDGNAVLAALGLPETPGAARSEGEVVLLTDPRLPALGARVVGERSRLALSLAASFAAADEAAYDRHRLALGIPDGSRDLVPDKSILLEAGFDELHGVDWEKGCYVGQELTARTKYRGLIKRRLFPVTIGGPAPAAGTLVTAAPDGREAGEMRSSRDGLGLALLRLEAIGGANSSALSVDGATVVPHRPAWMRLPDDA